MPTKTTKYEIYLMNVPFNDTYQHIVLFNSRSAQANAFININKYHFENLNIIVKNNTFLLRGRWDKFNECNYMMWRYTDDYGTDNDHTSKWYFSFINDVKYNTRLGTFIYHTLDVWQTYHIDARFNECFVERGHIKKSDDIIGDWIAPEPIGFGAENESETSIFTSLDFNPVLCIESLSVPSLKQVTVKNDNVVASQPSITFTTTKYKYGGIGSGADISGIYRIIPSSSYLNDLLALWQGIEYTEPMSAQDLTLSQFNDMSLQTQNHIADIISFSMIPEFLLHTTNPSTVAILGNVAGSTVTVGNYINDSGFRTVPSSVNINNERLACTNSSNKKFKPHNKKMFTSLARCFKIFNRNGVSIPLRPELIGGISGNSPSVDIKLYMHNYGNEIKITIDRYKDITHNFVSIPYIFNLNVGINNNVGVAKSTRLQSYGMNAYSSRVGYIGSVFGVAGQVGQAYNVGEMSQSIPVNTQMGASRQEMLANQAGLMGIGAIGSAFNVGANIVSTEFNLDVEKSNAYTSQTFSIGHSYGDRLDIDRDLIKLRFAECNPTYRECEIIDRFLDVYGYSIQEWGDLSYYISSRPKWNYIKTRNSAIKIDAPNEDTVIFNNIFNAGTTIWKSLNDVGDYSQNNGWN